MKSTVSSSYACSFFGGASAPERKAAERGRKTKCGEPGVVIAWGFIIIVECWGLYQCSLVKPYPIIRYCRVIR